MVARGRFCFDAEDQEGALGRGLYCRTRRKSMRQLNAAVQGSSRKTAQAHKSKLLQLLPGPKLPLFPQSFNPSRLIIESSVRYQ